MKKESKWKFIISILSLTVSILALIFSGISLKNTLDSKKENLSYYIKNSCISIKLNKAKLINYISKSEYDTNYITSKYNEENLIKLVNNSNVPVTLVKIEKYIEKKGVKAKEDSRDIPLDNYKLEPGEYVDINTGNVDVIYGNTKYIDIIRNNFLKDNRDYNEFIKYAIDSDNGYVYFNSLNDLVTKFFLENIKQGEYPNRFIRVETSKGLVIWIKLMNIYEYDANTKQINLSE